MTSQLLQSATQPLNNTSYLYEKIQQQLIHIPHIEHQYGEIFISNKQTNGALELIPESKGKQILNITGGKKKIFLFEEIGQEEHVVTAIHPENQDFIHYDGEETLPIDMIVQTLEGHKIAQIKCGQEHNVILTTDGSLFSFGKNTFGSLGLGGKIFMPSPQRITKLANKKIVSVACGFYHSLALSNIGDVYSWGRGFQGQLGLLKEVQTASSPQYITHFFKYDSTSKDGVRMLKKNPISYIACGASHSMAIDSKGNLYCWGEARFGQTGNGKKTKQSVPVQVKLHTQSQSPDLARKASKVDGGLGHTLCLTTQGEVFSWGLNIKGQLGLNDLPQGMKSPHNESIEYIKATYYPQLLKNDRKNQPLPKFKEIACGFCRSFAIDQQGNAWCWGGGALGFKDKFSQRGPTMLTQNTESRKFSKVFANENSLVLFSSLQLLFFKPALAPSRGNTQLTFFGYGFTQTGSQSARFKINNNFIAQVDIMYDDKTSTYYCKTPVFQKKHPNITYPAQCSIEISLDKVKYYPYDKKLLVYSSHLSLQSCDPKIGSAHGIGNLSIFMPLDNLTLQYVQSISVGFKNNSSIESQTNMKDWICSQGHYKDNNIVCKLPNVPQFDNDNPFYLIDVSLNGQEFTDHPQTFRYYWITETTLTPNQGFQEGQYEVVISGKGLFDTQSKILRLSLGFKHNQTNFDCERQVQVQWNKQEKNFRFKMPSIQWLIGDHVISPQLLEQARKHSVSIKLFYSKKDPIQLGSFKYTVPPPPVQPQQDKKDAKKDAKKGAKK